MFNRREFLAAGCGALVATGAEQPALRFAVGGYIWQERVEEGIRDTARFGFRGIEPYRQHVLKYLDQPQALKDQLDAAGIAMVTCSNGGGMSVDFMDPAKVPQTIEDHVRFARDFIAHFGCRHFKINLGQRPANGPTEEQLATMGRALNELGRRTADLGIRLGAHPHIWGPVEREHEVRRILEITDPKLVYLVPDTAHLTLGGMDPVRLIRDYFPRVVALHFKDTAPRFRGHRGPTPTQAEHRKDILYKNLGAGGVDFPAICKLLGERNFQGWITIDLDPPRPGEGTIDDNVQVNKKYLQQVLRVTL